MQFLSFIRINFFEDVSYVYDAIAAVVARVQQTKQMLEWNW